MMKCFKKNYGPQWVASVVIMCLVVKSNGQCFANNSDDTKSIASIDLTHVAKFSLDLFKELLSRHPSGNLFFSPYSIWNALALAYLGSEGSTKEQLEKALRINDKLATLKTWKALDYIYRIRQLKSKGYYFGMANRVYFDDHVKLKECSKEILKEELQLIDFGKPHRAAAIINEFVANVTDNKIMSVVSAEDVDHASMTLVNAAFFTDIWMKPFSENSTRLEPFHSFSFPGDVSQGSSHMDMMRQKSLFKHGVSEKLRAHVLELPYSLSDISMFIFLPPSIDGQAGYHHLINNLDIASIKDVIGSLFHDMIDVAVPKLRLNMNFDLKLKQALQSLGIEDLFIPDVANLSSFIPDGGVSVSAAVHKATLVLSEEGTEAAAVSALIGSARSARPRFLRTFVCDHPFLFMIYDKLTNNILFIGTVRSPSSDF